MDEVLKLNSENPTWKQKLEFVNSLLIQYKDDSKKFPKFKTEGLAILSAFLFFINTGYIKCGDEGHYRPCHQAGFAYSIFKILDEDLSIINNKYLENGNQIPN